MNKSFALFTMILIIAAFFVGRQTVESSTRKIMPLAIVKAGELYPHGHVDYKGEVRAGQDTAVMLFDKVTYFTPLNKILEKCGTPEPIDPSPENLWIECGSTFRIPDKASNVSIKNVIAIDNGTDIELLIKHNHWSR